MSIMAWTCFRIGRQTAEGGNREIYLMEAMGENLTKFTETSANEDYPL